MNRLIDTVLKEINNFESKPIYITDKVSFNQFETLKKIITHQNNGFTKKSNKKRFFFNIGNSRIDTVVKKIDFDTKDINLTTDDFHGLRTLFLESELRQYLKDTNHAQKINNIVRDFADIGNVVVKKNGESYDRVNLINLKVVDPTAPTLEDTTVIEEHKLNVTEFRRLSNEKGWDNAQRVIEEFIDPEDANKQHVSVYERYGELSRAELKLAQGEKPSDGDWDKYTQTLIISAIDKNNRSNFYMQETETNHGYILYAEELEPKTYGKRTFYKPYREAHFGAYQGRWFRKGPREKLIDLQDRANVLGNQIYEAMKWSSLHLFWSQDPNIAGRNIFKTLEQGQILQAKHIDILPVEERNLSAQVNEWNRLMDLADREIQSFEVATGETLPSGTTLGQVQIQTAAVGEHFDFLREELALMFKDVFNSWVLPDIIKNINKEHTLELSGNPEYLDKIFDLTAENWVKQKHLRIAALSGRLMNREQFDQLKEMKKMSLAQRPKNTVKILKDYYKDMKVLVDVVITGETVNKQTKVSNGLTLAQYITNPQIMQDPVARGIIVDVAESLGFDVKRAGMQPQQPQGQPRGRMPQQELKANQAIPEQEQANKQI